MKRNYFSSTSILFVTGNLKMKEILQNRETVYKTKTKPFFRAYLDSITAIYVFFLLLGCFSPSNINAQSPNEIKNYNGFNELYWKSMAIKKHLSQTETDEYLHFQKTRFMYPDSFIYKSSEIKSPGKGKVIGGGSSTQTVATGCNNIDFEAGSTSGWTLTSGFHPNSSSTPTCCPTSGAQNLVTSGAGVDPFGGFPLVFPGGSNSLRLGNSVNGAQADRIEQKIFITPANANFTYRYAVVLEDPGHNTTQQPAFTIEMIDTLGNQIPCTYYNVSAGSNIPGFFTSTVQSGVIYKPWTSVVVDLTPNIGQNLIIRFTTYDCSLGGHFGYAYIDGFCTNFATSIADTTCPGVPLNVCGPIGFGFYSWTGPGIVTTNSNQCIGITTPGVYTCQTILVPGCPGPTFTHTLSTLFAPVLSFTPTSAGPCAFNYSFAGTASIQTGSVVSYFWDFGNGLTSNLLNPTTTYTAYGTYPVKFKATSERSCSDSVITNITIYPYPVISFNPPNSCLNSVVNFSSTSTIAVGSVNSFTWSFGNGVVSTATNPTNTYSLVGSYNVTLTAMSDQGCTSTAVSALTIHPLPIVSFSATNLCFGNTTVFNPTVTISAGSISSFSWNLGNGNTSTNYSASTNYTAPGIYVVSFSATSNQQCLSSQTQTVSIYPLPNISFTVNGACLNTASSFTPIMSISLGTISTYSWNFGDGGTAGAINNPSHSYTTVNAFTPSLTALSNFGCTNTATATAVIYPLPNTAFVATTQCINSALNFSNTSSITSGTLISYLWNFGGGQTSGNLNPVYTFTNSGTSMVTLTALSDHSCSTTYTANMIIQPQPTVAALASQTLCSNINTLALTATVSGVTNTGAWSTSGSGAFTNSVALNTSYSITFADKLSGLIIFTLTSTNNSACASANNTMALNITPLATVNAGPNLNVCSSQNTLALNGSVNSPSLTGNWTTAGSGTFNPSSSNLNNSYAFTSPEINAGLMVFTLTSSNNGTCPAVSDTVMMRISKQPSVSVISAYTICSNANLISIGGTVTGVTNTGAWFSSGSGVLSNSIQLSPNYSLSTADRTLSALLFTLNSTNNGVCPAATQILSLALAPLATVNAGPNFTICSTQSLNLIANIIGSTNTGTWSSTGNGTFTSVNSLTTGYIPGTTDLLFGVVDLYLTSTNNGFCLPVRDTVHVLINKQATLTVVPSLTICSSFSTVALSGSIVGTSSTGVWTSSGTGSFNNPNLLNTSYSLSTADRSLSLIQFTLNSSNNGACVPATKIISVSVVPISTVDAGANQAICSAAQSVALNGSVISFPSGKWSGSSGGTFVNANSLSSIYYFSGPDITAGLVTLTLSSNNNSICPLVSDTIQIRIVRQATVNAGPDLSVCSNNNT
ncbi:MAG: PKD domain-containing protein, partial [Bacteroidota bacterium]